MSVTAHWSSPSDFEFQSLRKLYQLLASLSKASNSQEVYDAALDSLLGATSARRAAILLFDDEGVIRFRAARGLSAEYQEAVTGHCPWPRGTRDAHPVVVPDVSLDASLAQFRTHLDREGIRALAFIPLSLEAGVFGKFMLYYAEPHACAGEELEIAQVIAAHVALATERTRAEVARIRSDQQQQAILDNSAAVIFLKDRQGRYQLINRQFEELFHVTRADVAGKTDYDIFPAAAAQQFQANDRAVVAAGKPLQFEEYVPHDDGHHSYISVKFPIEGPDGAITGVCGIATDVTERKQLEAAVPHLAAIVENSADAIISKDLNGIIRSWNSAAEQIFGYTAAEALGKPVSMLAPPDRLDEMPAILERIRQGVPVRYETRRRRKDGQIIEVSLTVSPVRDAAGCIIGASKIVRDITAWKLAQAERASLHTREREARRTAELLNQATRRLAAQLNPERLAQEVTDIAATLVGAEFGGFFHMVLQQEGGAFQLSSFSGTWPDALAGFPAPGDEALFGRAFRGEGLVRATDQPPPVRSCLAAPIVARAGEVFGVLFLGHSLAGKFTENHETLLTGIAAQAAIAMDNARLFEQTQWVQRELKRSNEELRRVNRDLEVFAYSAGHDLQEPLRTIMITAQLLERSLGAQLEAHDAAFLHNISAASRRMNVLIGDLLAYTNARKHEEGPVPVVDSGRVLAGVLESLRVPIQESGAQVTTGDLPSVAIHEGHLSQLFQNLVANALKYRGTEAPHIHISAAEQDGWQVFSVADDGIGIEPQFVEQIFGLFKRLHTREQYPGSGMGLAICRRVIEQYGGRIWVERSSPGGGSTFCFSLPSRDGT